MQHGIQNWVVLLVVEMEVVVEVLEEVEVVVNVREVEVVLEVLVVELLDVETVEVVVLVSELADTASRLSSAGVLLRHPRDQPYLEVQLQPKSANLAGALQPGHNYNYNWVAITLNLQVAGLRKLPACVSLCLWPDASYQAWVARQIFTLQLVWSPRNLREIPGVIRSRRIPNTTPLQFPGVPCMLPLQIH